MAENKKIRFLLSPTGKFHLAYNAGDEAEINANQAHEIVSAGYAEYVNPADAPASTDVGNLGKTSDTAFTPEDGKKMLKEANDRKEAIIADAENKASEILLKAENDASDIVNNAKTEAEKLIATAKETVDGMSKSAISEGQGIIDNAKVEAEKILSDAREAAAQNLKVNGAETVETATDKNAKKAEKS